MAKGVKVERILNRKASLALIFAWSEKESVLSSQIPRYLYLVTWFLKKKRKEKKTHTHTFPAAQLVFLALNVFESKYNIFCNPASLKRHYCLFQLGSYFFSEFGLR